MKEMKATVCLFASKEEVDTFAKPGYIHASVSAGPGLQSPHDSGRYLLRAVYLQEDLVKVLGLGARVQKAIPAPGLAPAKLAKTKAKTSAPGLAPTPAKAKAKTSAPTPAKKVKKVA
jgi:hypothetical protein